MYISRSQWPRGLRRRSAAASLLRSWVRIPPGAWVFVCCECYVLSGRGLCDELITRPEGSYRLWCIVVCDQETSRMRRPWPALSRSATANKQNLTYRSSSCFLFSFGISSQDQFIFCPVIEATFSILSITADEQRSWIIQRYTYCWS